MENKFNIKLFFWALAVIQPSSIKEALSFLKLVYPEIREWPEPEYFDDYVKHLLEIGYIFCVNKKYKLYSLTELGNKRLDIKLRRRRDKARLSLLNAVYRARVTSLGAADQELDGASPSSNTRSSTQEVSRPTYTVANPRVTSASNRICWPRIVEQLNFQVGLDFCPPSISFRYNSFQNLSSIHSVSLNNSQEKDISLIELALCIGISPRLLSSFLHKPTNHYRVFTIGKRSGGKREIASPRFFLKTVQYWIKDYFLTELKIHRCCHAYRRGFSIISNAQCHLGKKYVANIDIENFFGNVTQEHVFHLLRRHELGRNLSSAIARLVTLDRVLPQGAPTSPIISNAVLFEFDEKISKSAEKLDITYTRYADDITFSGASKEKIERLVNLCSELLNEYGHKIKDQKTRIASERSSQRVTGLVVNEIVQPPRKYRRNIRAMFHNALKNPAEYSDRLDEIRGHYSYLKCFENINRTNQIKLARVAISKVTSKKNQLSEHI